ncbi:MAG: hypothetical protein COA48_07930 [Cycloclasticus sp.]|nr:MAG: hypothetical protein COA48_07930 [Cycloclasticus sp.]
MEESTPEVGDEIAVTGWKGTIWFTGSIISVISSNKASTSRRRGKLFYTVFFSNDQTYVDLELTTNSYGPARLKKQRTGQPDTHEHGWLFLVPLSVASRDDGIEITAHDT